MKPSRSREFSLQTNTTSRSVHSLWPKKALAGLPGPTIRRGWRTRCLLGLTTRRVVWDLSPFPPFVGNPFVAADASYILDENQL